MTDHAAALKLAVDLMHFPSQVRRMRSAPLPDGVVMLLRIAADDEEAICQESEWTGQSRATVSEAAAFFIEQILLYPGADSYRVLGANQGASNAELRHNMTLLLRWLHPDLNRQDGRSVFVGRVTRAWNDLKTQERRAAYDRKQQAALVDKSLRRKKGARLSKTRGSKQGLQRGVVASRQSLYSYPAERGGFLYRAILLLFGRAAN